MSRDHIPFLLHEAVLSLYPAAADGTALTAGAVWAGALANRLRTRHALEEVLFAASGDAYPTARHVGEENLLEIERTWILRAANLSGDFKPVRNQSYVLEAVWYADGYWLRRTWFGVTGRSVDLDSQGTNQFLTQQSFRAQRFVDDGGPGRPEVYTPLPPAEGDEQSIGFFRENPLIVGEYLLGHYRWPVATRLVSARVIAFPPQGADMELTLEINGTLTAETVVIPAGTPNVEVTADLDLNDYAVAAGASVRWKITDGPDAENSAWVCALTLQVQPVA